MPILSEPHFDRSTVDLAGDAMIGNHEAQKVLRDSGHTPIEVVNNWRAAHQYPMTIFNNYLRTRTLKIDSNGIVAQRTKRLSSIKSKLSRLDWLKLSEMQDIAGCRAIVSSVENVKELVELYKRKYANHMYDFGTDYISKPKSDGYRSHHLIFRYSDAKHPELEGLRVEMQFRSNLQHAWATAVETADIFYQTGLKSHRAQPEWGRFFTLAGAAIAIKEGTRNVPKTSKDKSELVKELRKSAADLDVKHKLTAFGQTLNVIGETDIKHRDIKFILLLLNPSIGSEELRLFGFRASSIEEATKQYEQSEDQLRREGEDAVLVSVSDVNNLRRAYPNYYLDTSAFIEILDEFIS